MYTQSEWQKNSFWHDIELHKVCVLLKNALLHLCSFCTHSHSLWKGIINHNFWMRDFRVVAYSEKSWATFLIQSSDKLLPATPKNNSTTIIFHLSCEMWHDKFMRYAIVDCRINLLRAYLLAGSVYCRQCCLKRMVREWRLTRGKFIASFLRLLLLLIIAASHTPYRRLILFYDPGNRHKRWVMLEKWA
jgi:hypothetical protein